MRFFVPSAQEENDHPTDPSEVNPVSRSPINPKLHDTAADGFDIPEVSYCNPCEARFNSSARLPIAETRQPLGEWLLAVGRLVIAELKFVHHHCNL